MSADASGRPTAPDVGGGFEPLDERTIHRGRVIHVVDAGFRGPGGEEFRRDIVRSPGAVAVVPVTDGPEGPEAVVLRQYRPALREWLVEIPAGLRDRDGEPTETTAARELAEEAGLAAADYELLTVFVNAAGMTDQRTHIYLARGLRDVPHGRDGVEEEYLSVERLPLDRVPALVGAGELTDAKTVIGLLLACRRFGL